MASKSVFNLDADTGANIIGDESTPVLAITNNGTGPAMSMDEVVVSSNATITVGKLTLNTPLLAANATITGFHFRAASVASGAIMAFGGNALVSLATILFTTGGAAGTKAIRIVNSDGTFGWIPVLPDAAVTGLAL